MFQLFRLIGVICGISFALSGCGKNEAESEMDRIIRCALLIEIGAEHHKAEFQDTGLESLREMNAKLMTHQASILKIDKSEIVALMSLESLQIDDDISSSLEKFERDFNEHSCFSQG